MSGQSSPSQNQIIKSITKTMNQQQIDKYYKDDKKRKKKKVNPKLKGKIFTNFNYNGEVKHDFKDSPTETFGRDG